MTLSRRDFIRSAQAVGLFYASFAVTGGVRARSTNPFFALIPDPARRLDLPEGFTYTTVSESGGMMADGFFRPGRPDGMACFADPDSADKCILMCNHENWFNTTSGSPFGEDNALLDRVSKEQLYDRKADGSPLFGGVTRLVYDLKNNRLESDHLVLTGTAANCAGGPTPWGSWLSCEEQPLKPADGTGKFHGFVFETPSSAAGLIDAVPLKAMGRFAHEAAAIDPETGIVYMTEDDRSGLFYRFIPDVKGRLAEGGRLQALAITGWKSAVTNNWPQDWGGGGAGRVKAGQQFGVEWIDLDDVESPEGDLAARGHAAGAAYFCRGEGMDYGIRPGSNVGEIFFTCTQGGTSQTGQVWRYTPGETGKLTLLYESAGADTLDLCDNLALAPWGDLILCEDGRGSNYLRGLTPDGKIYDFAKNAHKDDGEFCGACFSPDGKTMFVNVQEPGYTYAITGPWESLRV
ncbi:alkaline phosphatase PhoX [Parasphingorhabdus sp.]|uniref:alkaline phosphatase PhoX n=1 Tax=Parasphingorhabdus sp. TaxID=2709688 RepID=UPI003594804A